VKRFLWWLFLLAMLAVFGFAGWQLYTYWQADHEARQTFDQLAEIYQPEDGTDGTEPETGDADATEISEGVLALHAENPDCIGWVQIEGTNINYPVMYRPDSTDYYLHRDFYGNYSASGTPYVAEQCDLLTSDNVTVYGHHMNSGSMFADLDKYKSQSYFEEHPLIRFDTIYGNGTYQIIAVFVTSVYGSDTFPYYAFTKAENASEYQEFVSTCKELSLYDTGMSAEYGDRLLTLSTCEYSRTNGRVVVLAKKL
jgi:sortase B